MLIPRTKTEIDRAVERAVSYAENGVVQYSENEWMRTIERLRLDLASDTTEITFSDFGVGTPDSKIELPSGRTVTTTVGSECQESSIRFRQVLVLFSLIRSLRPKLVLEMGTCVGISAAYIAAALYLNQNGGHLISVDAATALTEVAKRTLKTLGLNEYVTFVNGQFQNVLAPVLERNRDVDLVFIDGHHDESATICYFELIIKTARPKVIVVDDIAWSSGMASAWLNISTNPNLSSFIESRGIGICAMLSDRMVDALER